MNLYEIKHHKSHLIQALKEPQISCLSQISLINIDLTGK